MPLRSNSSKKFSGSQTLKDRFGWCAGFGRRRHAQEETRREPASKSRATKQAVRQMDKPLR